MTSNTMTGIKFKMFLFHRFIFMYLYLLVSYLFTSLFSL